MSPARANVQVSAGPALARLTNPIRIAEQTWPVGTTPVVSIVCITYNHERFIRQCLEGFLMQETTFPVEIVVHDDASTDQTAEIVCEYQRCHPQLFRTIIQTVNQRSQGRKIFPVVLRLTRGEYYAYCEGDDYWTHSAKLEHQVALITGRPDLAMVSHEYAKVSADRESLPHWPRLSEDASMDYEAGDVLRGVFNHPNTWLARKPEFTETFLRLLETVPMGDDPVNLFLLQHKLKGLSLGKVWSVYRQHQGGVWSTLTPFQQRVQEFVLFVAQERFYRPLYTSQYRLMIEEQRKHMAEILGNEILQGRLRQAAVDLSYLARLVARAAAPAEALRVSLIALRVTVDRGLRGVLRRIVRRFGREIPGERD